MQRSARGERRLGGLPLRHRGRHGTSRISSVLAVLLALTVMGTVPPSPAAGQSRSSSDWALPADISPPVSKARRDRERPWADRCIGLAPATVPRNCVYGNPNGSFSLALVGDSHISHFFPAFERIAKERGWRLVVMLKIGCPFVDMPIRYPVENRQYHECATWNDNVVARLAKSPPDLTVVGYSHWIYPIKPVHRTTAAKAASAARMLQRLPGKRVLLADSLVSSVDVPVCLAANKADIRRCATPRKRAYRGHAAIESRAARQAGVPMIDIADRICRTDPCPAVVNKMIVYRDTHHLTATFTRTLWPDLASLLDQHL